MRPLLRQVVAGRALAPFVIAIGLLALAQLLTVGFVHPPTPPLPNHADAIVVLSGDHGDRVATGTALAAEGVAPLLVVLRPDDGPSAPMRPACGTTSPFKVECLDPELVSTRGDARAIDQLARQRHWRSVVVVTSRFHVLRAGILVRRCVGADVTTVGSRPPFTGSLWVRVIVHELGGLAQAMVVRGC